MTVLGLVGILFITYCKHNRSLHNITHHNIQHNKIHRKHNTYALQHITRRNLYSNAPCSTPRHTLGAQHINTKRKQTTNKPHRYSRQGNKLQIPNYFLCTLPSDSFLDGELWYATTTTTTTVTITITITTSTKTYSYHFVHTRSYNIQVHECVPHQHVNIHPLTLTPYDHSLTYNNNTTRNTLPCNSSLLFCSYTGWVVKILGSS